MHLQIRTGVAAFFLGLPMLSACGGDSTPVEPDPDPVVASIAITSAIDTVMAVDRATQLSAEARAADGTVVPGVDFLWRSTNAAAATMTADGVVQGVAAGATTIEAEAGDVVGALRMRVVAAELDTIEGLLDDPYTRALVAALGDDARAALEALLVSCVEALEEGHMLNLAGCLEDIGQEGGETATDQALLAVIGIVTTATEQFLGF